MKQKQQNAWVNCLNHLFSCWRNEERKGRAKAGVRAWDNVGSYEYAMCLCNYSALIKMDVPAHVDLLTPRNTLDLCLLTMIHFVSLTIQIYSGWMGRFPPGLDHLRWATFLPCII